LPKAGFFSNLGSNKITGNLFSPNKPGEDKEEAKKPGLFASSGPTPGLFSKDNKSTLFSDKPAGTFTSLFQSGGAQQNNFFKKNEDEDGGSEEGEEGDDDEPQRSPSPEADITKSKGNYQYQQTYDKIASQKVEKFKPGAKSLLPQGEVSLNKMNENVFFIIYRNKAKVIQYQGQLIRKVSTTSYLNERQDAMQVVTFSEEKGDPKEKGSKLSRDILKMMFQTSEQCNEFKKVIDNVLG